MKHLPHGCSGILVGIAALLVTGCAQLDTYSDNPVDQKSRMGLYRKQIEKQNLDEGLDVVRLNNQAADQLLSHLDKEFGSHQQIIVTTLSDMNKLESSTALGRLISENIANRIVQRGYHVGEIRMRNDIVMQNNTGEFILTRKAKELAATQEAIAVVAGTYSANPYQIFVNVRLIRMDDSKVLGAANYVLPINNSTRSLAGTSGGLSSIRLDEK